MILSQCSGSSAPEGVQTGSWTSPGDLKGVPWPFGKTCAGCDISSPPYGGKSIRPASAAGAGDASRQYQLREEFTLRTGDRLRYVIAWDSCPKQARGVEGASPVVTDYDLFLVKDGSTPVYSSQSVSDTTEGFDVSVPSDGKYQVVIGLPLDPAGTGGCGRKGAEPIAGSWAASVK